MKRYIVRREDTAFEDAEGDWLSYNQVVELLQFMWSPTYSREQIIDLIKNYKADSKIW